MPPQERRALLLLLSLAVAGQGVRYLITRPDEAPGGVQLLATLGAESPRAQRDSAMRQGRPLAQGEQIDVDLAPVAQLARLPKVGPRLAKTIVADRQAHGPFGSIDGLDRVPGIGPVLLKTIGPHVVFTGRGRPPPARSAAALLDLNSATVEELDSIPGIGPARAKAIVRFREENGRISSVEALAGVRGISGSLLALLRERVVAH